MRRNVGFLFRNAAIFVSFLFAFGAGLANGALRIGSGARALQRRKIGVSGQLFHSRYIKLQPGNITSDTN